MARVPRLRNFVSITDANIPTTQPAPHGARPGIPNSERATAVLIVGGAAGCESEKVNKETCKESELKRTRE